MKLPGNKVGISDLIQHQTCATRAEFSMKRWETEGEAPEAWSPSTAYGSIIHDVLHWIEQDALSDEEAIQKAFNEHAKWIEPEDLERLKKDLQTYHKREIKGVRTVGVEIELSMPIVAIDGVQYFFRGKIDRLYQSLADPTTFIVEDFKSSKWRKGEAEVDNDKQMSAYDLLVRYNYPEIEHLVINYNQLNFGVVRTSRTQEQRDNIREWIAHSITALVADEEMKPTFNTFCAYCPLLNSCGVVKRLSLYATAELAVLASPVHKMKKDGTPGKQIERLDLDPDLYDSYAEELPRVSSAIAALQRFEKTVKDALKNMPSERRQEYGYKISSRSATNFTARAVAELHREMGDDFYELISLSKAQIERGLTHDPELAQRILGMAEKTDGATVISRSG